MVPADFYQTVWTSDVFTSQMANKDTEKQSHVGWYESLVWKTKGPLVHSYSHSENSQIQFDWQSRAQPAPSWHTSKHIANEQNAVYFSA